MLVINETDPAAVNKLFADAHGTLAFDIGANCGQSVRRLLPGFERIVAVEPADESFQVLHDTYDEDPRVLLVHAACTNTFGPVTLDVRDIIFSGQLTTGDPGSLPWGSAHGSRTVDGVTVDQLAGRHGSPDLLKVDTEGHEVFVLQGATETLLTHPQVIIEVHSKDNGVLCRYLLEHSGFENLEEIPHHAYRPGSWGASNHYWLVSA